MIPFQEGAARGFLHRPLEPNGTGLVLTHGAGGNCKAPLLVAVAEAFCAAGYTVLRCDLPFRQHRPFGPPSPSAGTQDRAGLRDAVAAMRKLVSGAVILGGHSYGGRQSTILASEAPGLVDALLLFSYPLHPPGKPDQKRTAHFSHLHTPALFVHGTKDPFGSVREMELAVPLIPARTDIMEVDPAGHDLGRGKFDMAQLLVRLARLRDADLSI